MKTLDEYSRSQAEILVGYLTTDLESFEAPKSWTEKLGWKPESKELNYRNTLEDSICDAKKSRMSMMPSRIEHPELQRSLRHELNESQIFEERLKAALDPGSHPAEQTILVQQNHPDVSSIPQSQYAYEPVISALSPSLGKLARSRSALMRRKSLSSLKIVSSTPSLEGLGVSVSVKRKAEAAALKESRDRGVARSSSERLAKLRRNIEEDLNGSYAFEKRLQDAMTE